MVKRKASDTFDFDEGLIESKWFKFLNNYKGNINIKTVRDNCLKGDINQLSKLASQFDLKKPLYKDDYDLEQACKIIDKYAKKHVLIFENSENSKQFEENLKKEIYQPVEQIINDQIKKQDINIDKISNEQINDWGKVNELTIGLQKYVEKNKNPPKHLISSYRKSIENLNKDIEKDLDLTDDDFDELLDNYTKGERESFAIDKHEKQLIKEGVKNYEQNKMGWSFFKLLGNFYQKLKNGINKIISWLQKNINFKYLAIVTTLISACIFGSFTRNRLIGDNYLDAISKDPTVLKDYLVQIQKNENYMDIEVPHTKEGVQRVVSVGFCNQLLKSYLSWGAPIKGIKHYINHQYDDFIWWQQRGQEIILDTLSNYAIPAILLSVISFIAYKYFSKNKNNKHPI